MRVQRSRAEGLVWCLVSGAALWFAAPALAQTDAAEGRARDEARETEERSNDASPSVASSDADVEPPSVAPNDTDVEPLPTTSNDTDVECPSVAPNDAAVEPPSVATTCPRWRRRLAPVVSLLAGTIVHGAGSLTGCHRLTGRRLGLTQVAGLGALVVGGGGLVLSGASRRTIAPFTYLAISGIGLFVFSFVADLYASITDGQARGRPGPNAPYELSFGYRQIYDPQFAHDAFVHLGATGWLGRQRLFAEADVALDTDTQRGRFGVARRLLGGTGRGSSLEVEVASTWQRFGHDGFATLTGELSLGGRLDLADVGPALVGSFVEGSLGLGLQLVGYDATGGGVGEEAHALLLTRLAYGVYLGETGEVSLAYDHRRDGLEGGLSTNSVGAGNIGFLDLRGRGWFPRAPHWGVEGSVTVGSAWIFGANLLHRGSTNP
ncbi:MAG: hypothetical protein KC586_20575 [Myxococcales bacterium]|nr:hypothetical protein [Myxococcales bacterium]